MVENAFSSLNHGAPRNIIDFPNSILGKPRCEIWRDGVIVSKAERKSWSGMVLSMHQSAQMRQNAPRRSLRTPGVKISDFRVVVFCTECSLFSCPKKSHCSCCVMSSKNKTCTELNRHWGWGKRGQLRAATCMFDSVRCVKCGKGLRVLFDMHGGR